MLAGTRILGLVPARGGSKGIPRKNLQRVGGRTLVARALITLKQVPEVDRILLSSEDREIIEEGNQFGDFAPFVRPLELSQDHTPSLPVFQHALDWAENADRCQYDWLVVLEPPCPFRLPGHVTQGLELAIQRNASSVMSLVQLGDHHPIRVKRLAKDGSVTGFCQSEPEGFRRQDQEPAFIRNCAVLVFSRETLKSNRLWGDRAFGFAMDADRFGINIDDLFDLKTANLLYEDSLSREEQSRLCLDD